MNRRRVIFCVQALALILVLVAASSMANDRMSVLDGFCYLDGAVDHSGSQVLFEALSGSAVSDSALTDASGHFLIGLSEGLYAVHYSHDGYQPATLPGDQLFGTGSVTLPDITLLAGAGIDVSGDVSGLWAGGQTYNVIGDVTVPSGDALMIEPGVTVKFMGPYSMTVLGGLYAAGAVGDSILFTSGLASPAPGDWIRVQLTGTYPNSSSGSFQYCVFEYGGQYMGTGHDALLMLEASGTNPYAPVPVENCSFRRSQTAGLAIAWGSNATVANNILTANSGQGLICRDSSPAITDNVGADNASVGIDILGTSSPYVSGNTSERNLMGIQSSGSSSTIVQNTLIDNYGEGLKCENASGLIERNTVSGNNGNGIYCTGSGALSLRMNTVTGNGNIGIGMSGGAAPELLLNIISGNVRGVYCGAPPSGLIFNDVWGSSSTDYDGGGLPAYAGVPITVNANGDSCDTYFNLSLDPQFVAFDDYHLLISSPCIDAGPDSLLDADGTRADMGRYYYNQGSPPAPAVDFVALPVTGDSPLPVQFTHSNSGGPISSWLWDFGDGGSSTLPDPVHTYVSSLPDSFSVSLTVLGPGGGDQVTKTDLIIVHPIVFPPIASFSADPLTGFGFVQFTDESVGDISSWNWDFGDGMGTSTERYPGYTYPAPGTYSPSLTVTGPTGSDILVKPDYITIMPADTVIAGFTPSATFGVTPASIDFVNSSAGGITGYIWDFGDGYGDSVESPTHVYQTAGDYDVSLIASGPANADTAYASIRIRDAEPVILSIMDVPDDQGNQVYLLFRRSGYDRGGLRSSESYSVERMDGGTWTMVASGVAYGQDSYQYLVPTLRDSTSGDPGLTEFRVIAGMDEGVFIGDPAWGYSVDNIAPHIPTGFTVLWNPAESQLSWSASEDEDFAYFKIFRGDSLDFEPSPGNLVHETPGTGWLDDSAEHGIFYKLSAVDDSGNEGGAAAAEIVTGAGDPQGASRLALHACVPNPFNPFTTIGFELPSPSEDLSLEVYDVAGRKLRVLVRGPQSAGRHEYSWDGKDDGGRESASGIYFFRLRTEQGTRVRKAVLLR